MTPVIVMLLYICTKLLRVANLYVANILKEEIFMIKIIIRN